MTFVVHRSGSSNVIGGATDWGVGDPGMRPFWNMMSGRPAVRTARLTHGDSSSRCSTPVISLAATCEVRRRCDRCFMLTIELWGQSYQSNFDGHDST